MPPKKTGTRPCMCKQCDLRKGMVLGGLNTKGKGPGGVAFRSTPAGTASRRRLLDDLVTTAFVQFTSTLHLLHRALFTGVLVRAAAAAPTTTTALLLLLRTSL